jgi:xylulokinase
MAVAGARDGRRSALLGIDLGTSSVKVLVTDLDGVVLSQAAADYTVRSARPSWSESDPAEWLTATMQAVHEAIADSNAEPHAIGLSGQMHGVVAADATGQPLRPAMLWSDARASQQVALYRRLPERVLRRLGNPVVPGMAGPLLIWLSTEQPDLYRSMRWALQPKDWLRAQLIGRFATEPSDASATLLYDLVADGWDGELLQALDLQPETLPPVLPRSAEWAGELTEATAGSLGIRPGIPVAAGAADTAAAALGSGLIETDTVQLTIGTGIQIVRPVAELPDPLPSTPVTHTYRAATDKGWYAMAAALNGGLTLAWVLQVLDATWPELYAAAANDPRADDPFFLPHLHGERTPYLDPDMRGAWTGLGPRHGKQELLRASLEGVAFAAREALDCLVVRADPVPHIRLAGGGTTNPLWRQMLADILGYPLYAVDVAAASGLGATMLAARAANLADEATILARHAPATRLAAEPRTQHAGRYEERYQAFRSKVQALRTSAVAPP